MGSSASVARSSYLDRVLVKRVDYGTKVVQVFIRHLIPDHMLVRLRVNFGKFEVRMTDYRKLDSLFSERDLQEHLLTNATASTGAVVGNK